jgi:glycosyltransferase involved in cell wall biosynthesis
MPELKRKIVIASVLKPVNDTRMFEKIGLSLDETKKFEVHIIGFEACSPSESNIHFHHLNFFKRLSLKRIYAPWTILKKILSIQPSIIIITTHELLIISLLAKVFTGSKIIYDIQENYYRNILHTKTFPFGIRTLLAICIRTKEKLTAPFIDHFFLAEKGYETEFTFPGNRKTVLENKVKRPSLPQIKKQKEIETLLFTGTLAESTGVFIAIEVCIKLNKLNDRIKLIIIGYCALEEQLTKIKTIVQQHDFITLIGGERLVSHSEILEQIKNANAGIISYPPNPSTTNSIPTKLFEYLGYKLPILLIRHTTWEIYCKPYNAAVVFDYPDFQAKSILSQLNNQNFYPVEPTDIYWENEQQRLIRVVYSLLK